MVLGEIETRIIGLIRSLAREGQINQGLAEREITSETKIFELHLDSMDKVTTLAGICQTFDVELADDALADFDSLAVVAGKVKVVAAV